MIHRTPIRERLAYILFTIVCAGSVALLTPAFLKAGSIESKLKSYKLGGAIALTGLSGYLVYLSWRSHVRVDGRGVDWREGGESGALPWDEIQGLGGERNGKNVRPCLVDKSSRNHILPFLTPELYAELRVKCGPLSPELESELKLRK